MTFLFYHHHNQKALLETRDARFTKLKYRTLSLVGISNKKTIFFFSICRWSNILDIVTLKNYSLLIWNSNLTRRSLFYLASLIETLLRRYKEIAVPVAVALWEFSIWSKIKCKELKNSSQQSNGLQKSQHHSTPDCPSPKPVSQPTSHLGILSSYQDT